MHLTLNHRLGLSLSDSREILSRHDGFVVESCAADCSTSCTLDTKQNQLPRSCLFSVSHNPFLEMFQS